MSDLSKCALCGRDLNGVVIPSAKIGDETMNFCTTAHMLKKMNEVRVKDEQEAAAAASAPPAEDDEPTKKTTVKKKK